MATDPATLLNQASCYICYGAPGTDKLMEIVLMAQWAALVESSAPNLIPPGAMYGAGGLYTFTVNIGQTYHLTFGVDEASAQNGAQNFSPPQNNAPFTATSASLVFGSTAGQQGILVTAKLTTP